MKSPKYPKKQKTTGCTSKLISVISMVPHPFICKAHCRPLMSSRGEEEESNYLKDSFMGKKVKWSWTSALVGAATATAAVALISAKPKDPTFHLIKINLSSFKLKFPIIDTDLILTVHVTNPNIIPIHYSSTTMSIFYDGSLIGSAQVEAGSQRSRSCQTLELTARLNGVELMARHAAKFFSDVAKREMVLDARVDIGGTASLLWWGHRFNVHVDSHITVDPVFLDIIDQENKSSLEVFLA